MFEVKEHIYATKDVIIQNGDFAQIKSITKSFNIKNIYASAPIIYSENDITNQNKFIQVDTPVAKTIDKNFVMELIHKADLQIIQVNISNIFNTCLKDTCYLPAFKNVLFEKKDNSYIAIYFIILNLLNPNGKNGILKLAS
jgi:hypothetical protein